MKIRQYLLPAAVFVSPCLQAQPVEEIIITSARDNSVLFTDDTLVSAADTASMLRRMPGANFNKSGELSGIAQYRGMYGDRVNVAVNGSKVAPGGPNAMDAPLHYAPVAMLESLTIQRGITPVSVAQESIGGNMNAVTYSGDFAESAAFAVQARVYAGGQTVNNGTVASVFVGLANDQHLFRAGLMQETADDTESADFKITPSEYERDRFDLGYSFQNRRHQFSIDVAVNNTGNAGTAALPMDILSVDSTLFRSSWQYDASSFRVKAKLTHNELEHWMTNYHLRQPPQGTVLIPGPMMYRSTFATGDSDFISLQLEQDVANGLWRYGADLSLNTHNADISNPNAAAFAIRNFNDNRRDIAGVFVERELSLTSALGLEAGLRVNQVSMDAGQVSANLNPMGVSSGMPVMMNNMASMLAMRFNNQQLQQDDTNADWFVRLSLQGEQDLVWYLGLARKSRSASYQERYLWLPLEATGGLADGLTYVGQANLDAEVAHEIELGFDWQSSALNIYPRVFYRRVDDYIQGIAATDPTVIQFAQMMANMGMGRAGPLQFANTDAALYGADLEANMPLGDALSMRANVSIVRGERKDVSDELYRISPDNLLLALDYASGAFIASLETQLVRKQDRVSATNSEQGTAGYALLNASVSWQLPTGMELRAGIDNLLDRQYTDHLAAYNRAANPDLPRFNRLPGTGRNLYARFIWTY